MELLAAGMQDTNTELDPTELAGWTQVSRVILSLHETITRY